MALIDKIKPPQEKGDTDKRESRKQKRNEALNVLKELVDKQQDPKYKEALSTIRPSLYGIAVGRGGGTSLKTKFIDLVIEKKQISEDEIFKLFKIGRKECATFIKKSLIRTEPKDRVWINFDPKSGNYKVVGTGEKAPQEYTGYVPIAKVELK